MTSYRVSPSPEAHGDDALARLEGGRAASLDGVGRGVGDERGDRLLVVAADLLGREAQLAERAAEGARRGVAARALAES